MADIISKARELSDNGLVRARQIVSDAIGDTPVVIGVNGSFARREATSGSDLDIFYLYAGSDLSAAAETQIKLNAELKRNGFKLPSAGGVFDEPKSIGELTEKIGGTSDTNETTTIRMLLLLEGEWLSNESHFNSVRRRIIEAYVPNDVRTDHICLFLLNDVIRYWRTICVDYEHKLTQRKAKAIRLTKLRFSRMLLYFGGLIAAAETLNLPANEKREKLLTLFARPTIERVTAIFGNKAESAIENYSSFLIALDDEDVREELENVSLDLEASAKFQTLRSTAKEFKAQLAQLLTERYPADHPIHMALIF